MIHKQALEHFRYKQLELRSAMICAIHCIGTAMVTLTSTLDGRQAACPGEVMTYTCTALRTTVVSWFALPDIDGVDYVPKLESNWAASFWRLPACPY